MKTIRLLPILVTALALLLPSQADAQFRKLRDRIQQRAEDRIEQKAEEKVNQAVDKQVDKLVDAAFERTEAKINDMISSALSRNRAEVDLENTVIRQEGREDVRLTENQTSPARADYVDYLSVTVFELPGPLGNLLGNGMYEHVYLHGDKHLSSTTTSATLTDLEAGQMVFMDFEDGSYYVQPFSDFGAMIDEAAAYRQRAGDAQAGQMDGDATDRPEMDFEFDIREGRTDVIRGSRSRQHFVLLEAQYAAENSDTGESVRGNIHTVTEVWTTTQIAGWESLQDYQIKLGEKLGAAFGDSDTGQSLQTGMMADPRIGAAIEEAGRKLATLEGLAIQSETYIVLVPEGKELDLDKVLADQEPDMQAWSQSMSNETGEESTAPQEQVTLFSTLTFVSNMNTSGFSEDVLAIPADLEKKASPLEVMRQSMNADN